MSLPLDGTVRVGRGFLRLCYYPSWFRDIPACLLLARLARGKAEARLEVAKLMVHQI